jgi:hypothetical protein
VSQTYQTLLLAGTPLLAVIITFIGTSYQQRQQERRSAKDTQDRAISELLSAALDLLSGVRAIRAAHARRTTPRYYLRAAAVLMRAVPELTSLRVLTELETIKSLTGSALELDRDQMDQSRMIALDAAAMVFPKMNRYFAVAALLTLGDDTQIAEAVRELTPKLSAVLDATGARQRKFDSTARDLEKAMKDFRTEADKRRTKKRRLRPS